MKLSIINKNSGYLHIGNEFNHALVFKAIIQQIIL
jgi:hypothetical protein